MSFERFNPGAFTWEAPAAPAVADGGDDRQRLVAQVRDEIELLEGRRRPRALSEEQWYQLLQGCRHVAESWLDLALICGWELLDLFGAPPAPKGRVGLMGVALLLRGRNIEIIDQDRIVIANRLGAPNVFRRPYPGVEMTGADLIWNVIDREEWL